MSHGEQIMLGNSGEVVQEYYMLNQQTAEAAPALPEHKKLGRTQMCPAQLLRI